MGRRASPGDVPKESILDFVEAGALRNWYPVKKEEE